MFSGKIAFENMSPFQLISTMCMLGKRPEFDAKFPKNLQSKIECGWSQQADKRCQLNDFFEVLLEMKNPSVSTLSQQQATITETACVSMVEQATHAQMQLLPYSSLIEMKWPAQNEQTRAFIENMINNMRQSSSFNKILSDTVVNAMLQVPKHLFVDMTVFKNVNNITNDNECLKSIYIYNKAFRVSQSQNMSSTEITAAQLSFIPINSGDRVLFLGAKGGYIQTIAAQIVGFQGQVWICSQDNQGLEHIGKVLKTNVPPIIKQIIKCVLVKNTQDANEVKKELEKHFDSTEQYFNTIHVCGAIPQDSLEYFGQFLKVDGQLLAPINTDGKSQKFTILNKIRNSTSGAITVNKRILNDWGIIFGDVL